MGLTIKTPIAYLSTANSKKSWVMKFKAGVRHIPKCPESRKICINFHKEVSSSANPKLAYLFVFGDLQAETESSSSFLKTLENST